jgi:PAS domain S-box-containing protein
MPEKQGACGTDILDLIIGMLIVSAASMTCLGLYGRRYVDRVPAATPYVLIMFAAAAWAVLYALDLLAPFFPQRIAYHNLRFLFLPYFSVLELWLVVAYVRKTEWLRRQWAALVLVIPVTATVLALTSSYHDLFRYDFWIDAGGPIPVLRYSESGFFLLYSLYSILLLLLAVAILVMETRKQGTLREKQTIILILALAVPTIINTSFQAGFTPVPGVNLTSALFWIPALLYTVALFRYRFLDIIPIARGRLIEILSKPVLVLDADSRIIDLNPAACTLFSLKPTSVIGKPVGEVIPDWPEFLSLCRTDRNKRTDLVLNGDAGTRYFIGTAELLLTAEGETEGRLIVLQDVTDIRKAEMALRESEETYRTIIDNMQDLFYRTDNEGRITMINASGARLAGYDSPDQLIGRNAAEMYIDPDGRRKFLDVLKKTGSVYAYPLLLRARDGSIRNVTTSSHFHRDPRGNILGVEGIIHDMTDQRHAEEALQIANRKLNLLSSITRHDIRNQLMALMTFLQLSKDTATEPAQFSDYLAQALKISETIDRQIGFTKDYEDLGVKAPVWQDISSCIGRASAGLNLQNVRIGVETHGLEVYADPLLEKVFYNLIDNALRYGGEHLTTITVSSRPAGTGLVLVFTDDGAGIARDDKPRLFDKGFGRNTGLGLFLSREILSITGITITETGVPGRGARFEMAIPAGGFRFEGQST